MERAEFSTKTTETLAKRSGYRCSFPECDKTTIGPGSNPNETSSIGVASHIFAASEGGPRGTGGLSKEERSSIENGIWLCADHARLIDVNGGNRYSSELLVSYKALHECMISNELGELNTPIGWLYSATIKTSPIFRENTQVYFGKLTLIVGNNVTGKSALCEWIALSSSIEYGKRWFPVQSAEKMIDIIIRAYKPNLRECEIKIVDSAISYSLDGSPLPLSPHLVKVVYPRTYRHYEEDDVSNLAYVMRLDEQELLNLWPEVQRYEKSSIKNVRFEINENGKREMRLDIKGTVPGLSLRRLSGREQERVVLECAAAIARCYARFQPTVLILDQFISIFFEGWFENYTPLFADAREQYQTILTIPTRSLDLDKIHWLGWQVIRTYGKIPDVCIEQRPRTNNL